MVREGRTGCATLCLSHADLLEVNIFLEEWNILSLKVLECFLKENTFSSSPHSVTCTPVRRVVFFNERKAK